MKSFYRILINCSRSTSCLFLRLYYNITNRKSGKLLILSYNQGSEDIAQNIL